VQHYFLKYNWPSILWAAFILWLCLLPGRDLPSVSIVQIDKAAHFIFYVILAWLTASGWQKQQQFKWLKQSTWLKVLVITFSYGFAVEWIQETFTTDRHFDIYDAVANGAGAVAGNWLHYWRYKK